MNRSLIAVCAALGLFVSGSTMANPYDRGYGYDRYYDSDRYVYAEVVRVDPIYARTSRPIQREECWSEPVRYRESGYYARRDRDRTPAILGAIVGGAIGNQFGSGSGRDAATVAGAALGYSAVRDSQRRDGYYYGGREYSGYEQRCAVRTDYVADERITGYDVTYRYRGRLHHTTTDYYPGDRIRIPAY